VKWNYLNLTKKSQARHTRHNTQCHQEQGRNQRQIVSESETEKALLNLLLKYARSKQPERKSNTKERDSLGLIEEENQEMVGQ
jgi:hypothetical protein